ncbi:hypothetical protein DRP05_05820 [Archaeoglobales archaeon]|nr:MAG: hypothetical protein DRP05_05820 [Archaeoglobales archaeon]
MTEGELFERAIKILEKRMEIRKERLKRKIEREDNPEIQKKLKEIVERKMKPKAAIIIEVEEVYPCM